MDPTDEQLIAAHRKGDEEALHLLIERNIGSVFNFTYRLSGSISDAEDITQATFVKVWRNLHSFDDARRFRPWLFAIARNAMLDEVRKRKHTLFSSLEAEGNSIEETLQDNAPLPDEEADSLMRSREARKALDRLSNLERTIIMLHLDEDMTFQEIGDILGEPLNTVKSRYRRTLEALKRELKNLNN